MNLLRAFIFLMAGICPPGAAYAGKSGSQTANEAPSCTPEMSIQGDARPSSHRVILSWKASTSPSVVGYNVYRRDKMSSTFAKINQKPIAATTCVDYFVQVQHKYFYYVVAADHQGAREGGHANVAHASIPRK
jgi:fibronectin type 3 domain-containing protein